jgi:hypothetical protein
MGSVTEYLIAKMTSLATLHRQTVFDLTQQRPG